MTCPGEAELAAGGESSASHLASCARCRATVAGTTRVAGLATGLPWRDSSAERVDEMRAELLAAAAQPGAPARSRIRPLAIALVAAAAIAVVGLGLATRSAPTSVAFHATISPQAGATWLRASSRPDEIVRLVAGTIAVDVSPLAANERFRVITGDAEVEVKGTSFEVVADRDRLVGVRVWSGHVRVAVRGEPDVILAPGGSWLPAAAITATIIPTPPIVPPPPRSVATVPRAPTPPPRAPPLPPQPSEAERSYETAWQALRAGDYPSAASGFTRTAALASPFAEDAAFWRGVSLARAKSSTLARDAFAAFLDRFPRSPRAGEASAMLGWLLVDAGDPAAAASRFRAAQDDPADSVRDSARRGLAAIRRE